MDPKEGPQTSKMGPKINENLAWGLYRGQEGSPGSNLRSQGCPGGSLGPKFDSKTSKNQYSLGSSVGSQGGLFSDSVPVGNLQRRFEKQIFEGGTLKKHQKNDTQKVSFRMQNDLILEVIFVPGGSFFGPGNTKIHKILKIGPRTSQIDEKIPF